MMNLTSGKRTIGVSVPTVFYSFTLPTTGPQAIREERQRNEDSEVSTQSKAGRRLSRESDVEGQVQDGR